jgi:multidrug resistance efflux pump
MKKRFIRIGIIFIVVMIICFFLSRSLSTLWTAKVDFIIPQYREISRVYTLEGRVEVLDECDIYYSEAMKYPRIISEVNVTAGDMVNEGDVMFVMEPYGSLDDDLQQLYDSLDLLLSTKASLQRSITINDIDLESEISLLTLDYIQLGKSIVEQRAGIVYYLKSKMGLKDYDIDLSEDGIESILVDENTSEELSDMLKTLVQTEHEYSEVEKEFNKKTNNKNSMEFQMTLQWLEVNNQIDKTQDNISEILEIIDKTEYVAPASGLIMSINVEKGNV